MTGSKPWEANRKYYLVVWSNMECQNANVNMELKATLVIDVCHSSKIDHGKGELKIILMNVNVSMTHYRLLIQVLIWLILLIQNVIVISMLNDASLTPKNMTPTKNRELTIKWVIELIIEWVIYEWYSVVEFVSNVVITQQVTIVNTVRLDILRTGNDLKQTGSTAKVSSSLLLIGLPIRALRLNHLHFLILIEILNDNSLMTHRWLINDSFMTHWWLIIDSLWWLIILIVTSSSSG